MEPTRRQNIFMKCFSLTHSTQAMHANLGSRNIETRLVTFCKACDWCTRTSLCAFTRGYKTFPLTWRFQRIWSVKTFQMFGLLLDITFSFQQNRCFHDDDEVAIQEMESVQGPRCLFCTVLDLTPNNSSHANWSLKEKSFQSLHSMYSCIFLSRVKKQKNTIYERPNVASQSSLGGNRTIGFLLSLVTRPIFVTITSESGKNWNSFFVPHVLVRRKHVLRVQSACDSLYLVFLFCTFIRHNFLHNLR